MPDQSRFSSRLFGLFLFTENFLDNAISIQILILDGGKDRREIKAMKYFDGDKVIEVEADEKLAAGYKEIQRYEDRIEKRRKRHESIIPLSAVEARAVINSRIYPLPIRLKRLLSARSGRDVMRESKQFSKV